MKEILDSIRVNLFERITSPLFGAFAISWCGWNYRFFLVAFGDMNTLQKLTYTQAVLYPDWHTTLGDCVVWPLVSAAIFIAAYPFPARWSFAYWHGMQLRQKELRDKMDKATLLTADESHAIRSALLEQKWKFQKSFQEQATKNEELEARVNQAREEYLTAESEKARALQRAADVERDANNVRTVLGERHELIANLQKQLKEEQDAHAATRQEFNSEIAKFRADASVATTDRFSILQELTEAEHKILRSCLTPLLGEQKGMTQWNFLRSASKMLGDNQISPGQVLSQATKRRLVKLEEEVVSLTDMGRRYTLGRLTASELNNVSRQR